MPKPDTASIEQEVKFYLTDPSEQRRFLPEIGAVPYQPRILETNIRFDSPDGRLTKQHIVLRLRNAGKCILTFKQPEFSGAPESSGARRKLETEILVDNMEKAEHILAGLGFFPLIRYEKHREVFRRRSCLIMFDQLPFGEFLELEGTDLEDLRETAALLGLEWSHVLQVSYMSIFLALKRRYNLPFLEATFKNFTGWDPSRTKQALSGPVNEVLHDNRTL